MDRRDIRLETENLILRELAERDHAEVHAYASDPEVVDMLRWGPNSEGDTRAFLERAARARDADPRRSFTLAVVLKAEERVVGACRLLLPIRSERLGKITFVLNKSYWRRGLMAEAARELLRFGFVDLELNRIFGTTPAKNWGSGLVLEKIGMKKEALLDRHLLDRDGGWIDAKVYSAFRREWLQESDTSG